MFIDSRQSCISTPLCTQTSPNASVPGLQGFLAQAASSMASGPHGLRLQTCQSLVSWPAAAAWPASRPCMQDLWAGFAIAMNSGNSLAHQRRARARQAYGFLAGAESDWQNAILAACDGYNTAKIEEVCDFATPPHV